MNPTELFGKATVAALSVPVGFFHREVICSRDAKNLLLVDSLLRINCSNVLSCKIDFHLQG